MIAKMLKYTIAMILTCKVHAMEPAWLETTAQSTWLWAILELGQDPEVHEDVLGRQGDPVHHQTAQLVFAVMLTASAIARAKRRSVSMINKLRTRINVSSIASGTRASIITHILVPYSLHSYSILNLKTNLKIMLVTTWAPYCVRCLVLISVAMSVYTSLSMNAWIRGSEFHAAFQLTHTGPKP